MVGIMKNSYVVLFSENCLDDQINEGEVGRTCSAHGGREK